MSELTPEEAATVERFDRAPDALVEDLRDEVADAVISALWNVSRLPEWMQVPALGRNLRPLGDLVANTLLPLIAQREAAARAEAWDNGYACGLGDYGKSDDETRAANPYICEEGN